MIGLVTISISWLVAVSCFPIQVSSQVSWSNIDSTYDNLNNVQPYVVNNSGRTIYFIKTWPFVTALTLRFNDDNRKWETGSSLGCCETASALDEPVDLRPGQGIRVNLDRPEFVVGGKLMFMLADSSVYRPLPGRYKLRLLFALEPWTLVEPPSATFSTDSPEFMLIDRGRKGH